VFGALKTSSSVAKNRFLLVKPPSFWLFWAASPGHPLGGFWNGMSCHRPWLYGWSLGRFMEYPHCKPKKQPLVSRFYPHYKPIIVGITQLSG
jgi:hypothetical protein